MKLRQYMHISKIYYNIFDLCLLPHHSTSCLDLFLFILFQILYDFYFVSHPISTSFSLFYAITEFELGLHV